MGLLESLTDFISKRLTESDAGARLHPGQRIALQRHFDGDVRPRDRDDSEPEDGGLHASESRRQKLRDIMTVDMDRKRRLKTFEEMDKSDIGSAAVDMYAEDATPTDPESGKTVWIESDSAAVKEAAEEVLENLEIEDEILSLARNTALYGESFERLIYEPERGVRALFHVPAGDIKRHEDRFKTVLGFSQEGLKYNQGNIHGKKLSDPWDFIHFRLWRHRSNPYGISILQNAIRPWRQCVVQGTKIWTDCGPVNIEDLLTGSVVYCHNGDSQETNETDVVAVTKTGHNRVFRVRTAHRQITVTADHQMLVRDENGKIGYKDVRDLSANLGQSAIKADQLVLPSIEYGAKTHTIRVERDNYSVWLTEPCAYESDGIVAKLADIDIRTSVKNAHAFLNAHKGICYRDYEVLRTMFELPAVTIHFRGSRSLQPAPFNANLEFVADRRFARVFGFMLGDGWIANNGNVVGIALGVDEEQNREYIERFTGLFNNVHHSNVAADPGVSGAQELFYSAALVDLLRASGFVTGFANKVIPGWMFKMSRAFKRELIRGLLDADGGYQAEGKGWRLTLANKLLIEQVTAIAQQAGFYVSREIAKITRECRQTAYRIWVRELPHDESVIYENVTHVDDAGYGDTYDITVDDELHNFVAGGVVVHNCILGEDQALMYRLMRAPDRFAFFVDTGSQGEIDAWQSLQRFRRRHKKMEFVDPVSGRYDHRFNPITPLEDIYLAVSGKDSATKVEKLFGSNNQNDVTDLIYYIRKFCAAVRIPPEFMGFNYTETKTASTFEQKTGLANQSKRYANACGKLQRAIREGIRHIIEIHLRLKASNPEDTTFDSTLPKNAFRVMMAPVSHLDDQDRLDAEHIRTTLAASMIEIGVNDPHVDLYNWTMHVMKKVFRLRDDELEKLLSKEPQGQEFLSRPGTIKQGQEKVLATVVSHAMTLLEQQRANAIGDGRSIANTLPKRIEKAVTAEDIERDQLLLAKDD